MATAATITPTEEKTHGYRLLSLVIEGGALVLRLQFDQAIPPKDLHNKLCDTQVRRKLTDLKKKKKITDPQWNVLYPQTGNPVSADFDISLLTILLHHICGLDEQSRSWQGIPPSSDTSLEADIQRMRLFRNEMCHLTPISFTGHVFSWKWHEIEQVILRLGCGIASLKQDIQMFKNCSIDPEKENYYQKRLREWDEIEHQNQSN